MMEQWIRIGKERGASDLHLESGQAPVFRIRGELVRPAAEDED